METLEMAYRQMYEIEVEHAGLNKYRHIRGSDYHVVQQKASAQLLAWDEMWERKQAVELKRQERNELLRDKEEKKELAAIQTDEAQKALDNLESTLAHTLTVDDTIDWSSLLDRKAFPKKKPSKPQYISIPDEPKRSEKKYQLGFNVLALLFSGIKKSREDKVHQLFLNDHSDWIAARNEAEVKNKNIDQQYLLDLSSWEEKKLQYEKKQHENNNIILQKRDQYHNKDPYAITDYCEMVLSNSKYPDCFPQEWDLEYIEETKILIVDYSLPDIEEIPTLKSVKYVASNDDFSETHLSESALNKIYDSLLYQIALRTVHELYEADVVDAICSIVFNGWVDSIDKATGQSVNKCIMSLQAAKDEFLDINLHRVDPKACFKQLKGVGSSKLHGLSPVAPVMSINKEDRRFISAYSVMEDVSETNNLAAMDWQDFENLIREIFEKEFSSSGGEVKITQASRDGGVDAIAFDPDPIRGGKIVIQAKRYTNVVGVSAVRDLYGTTMNEGATKGILVTTADFGPDAYEFARGKPLTLLNGGNLLSLLERHGHKAKIDLKEAKKILSEQKSW